MASPEEIAGIKLAQQVRDELNLSALPIRDLIEVLSYFQLDVVVMDVDRNSPEEGLTMVDPELGIHVIATRTTPNSSRQRFTLAHELGHVLSGEHCAVDKRHQPSTTAEKKANYFARHLLLPTDAAKTILKSHSNNLEAAINAALCQYHVSPDVARFQLERTGVPREDLAKFAGRSASSFAKQYGWMDKFALRSRMSNEPQSPRLLTAQLARAFEDGFVTKNEVTSWNCTSLSEWEELEKAVQD